MNPLRSFTIQPGVIPDLSFFGQQPFMLLNSNASDGRSFLALGVKRAVKAFTHAAGTTPLRLFLSLSPAWYFGVMAYEFGNRFVLPLSEGKSPFPGLPQYYFFEPLHLAVWQNDRVDIFSDEPGFARELEEAFNRRQSTVIDKNRLSGFNPTMSKDDYLNDVHTFLDAIARGDIYEANYCYTLEGKGEIDPWQTWLRLNALTSAPFSGYFQTDNQALLCGSPERFLSRNGNTLCSQPIKGTRRRGDNRVEDEELKQQLRSDAKERSENIMITDLVRNDLSRLALPDSVRVEELCEVKSYKTVHQMVSTICAELPANTSFSDIIAATFPMGSMTGAPKASAMKLIARCERSPRGWYSGSMGWIDPEGNFDFNVIIRSIYYHQVSHEIRAGVGSAITAACDPEAEWEECALKARALVQSLGL